MADQEAEAGAVQIDRIAARTMIVPIIGTTPLVVHRFSEKAKRKMLDSMQGKKDPKEIRDPDAEFQAAAYRLSDGRYGFPAVAFKSATVSAARFYPKNDVTMTGLRQFLFFAGEHGEDGTQLVPILGEQEAANNGHSIEWPRMREDVVRIGRGSTDLRYRPEFWPWRAELRVTYITSALTQGSVLSLIDAGGMGVGVGEWRPERSGDLGMYQVDTERGVVEFTASGQG